jgi:hypothetical protein
MAKKQATQETAPPTVPPLGGGDGSSVLHGTRTLSCDLFAEDEEDELCIEMDAAAAAAAAADDDDDDDDEYDDDDASSPRFDSPEAKARYEEEQNLKKEQEFVKKETFRVNISKFIVVLAIIVAGAAFSVATHKVVLQADVNSYYDAVRIHIYIRRGNLLLIHYKRISLSLTHTHIPPMHSPSHTHTNS